MKIVFPYKRLELLCRGASVEVGAFPVAILESEEELASFEADARLSTLFSLHHLEAQQVGESLSPRLEYLRQGHVLCKPLDALSWYEVQGGERGFLRQAFETRLKCFVHDEWLVARHRISLREPKIMGIWNLSPESFSYDFEHFESGIGGLNKLCDEGADIVDIGAESTNPQAPILSASTEISRLESVISRVSAQTSKPISLDSYHLETMRRFCQNIDIINDVGKLASGASRSQRNEEICDFLSSNGLGYVAMAYDAHDAIEEPSYGALIKKILRYLGEFLSLAYKKGIDLRRIVLDPGIGFGKGLGYDASLLCSAFIFRSLGRPVLIGHSRKRFLGEISNRPLAERDNISSIANAFALLGGASIIRVHQVDHAQDARALFLTCASALNSSSND